MTTASRTFVQNHALTEAVRRACRLLDCAQSSWCRTMRRSVPWSERTLPWSHAFRSAAGDRARVNVSRFPRGDRRLVTESAPQTNALPSCHHRRVVTAAFSCAPDRHLGGRQSREDGRDYGLPDHRPYIQHFAGDAARVGTFWAAIMSGWELRTGCAGGVPLTGPTDRVKDQPVSGRSGGRGVKPGERNTDNYTSTRPPQHPHCR